MMKRGSHKKYIYNSGSLHVKRCICTALECVCIIKFILPYIHLHDDGLVEVETCWGYVKANKNYINLISVFGLVLINNYFMHGKCKTSRNLTIFIVVPCILIIFKILFTNKCTLY
jgi:hypothetical protein